MVPDAKSGRVPTFLPNETAESSPRGGWFDLLLTAALYMSAAVVVQLLLAAWRNYVYESDE